MNAKITRLFEGVLGALDGLTLRRLHTVAVKLVNKNYFDVVKFQDTKGLWGHGQVQHLTERKLRERLDHLREELDEFEQAIRLQDMEQQADALIDITYLAMGTGAMLGLPWQEMWDDVHRANMDKVKGPTRRGQPSDVYKPAGWVGPRGLAILKAHGYNPEDALDKAKHRDDEFHTDKFRPNEFDVNK